MSTAWIIIANASAVSGLLGIWNFLLDYTSRIAPWLLGVGLIGLSSSMIFGGLR